MSISPILVYAGILIVGIVVLMIGRTMDTSDEEKWKEGWREWISGPPGYYRGQTIMLGVLLIIIGTVGIFYALFFLR